MSRSFPSLHRGLLVAALAAAAPLQLLAAVTLSLRGVPAATHGGQALAFQLEAGGDCAGKTVTVTAFIEGGPDITIHVPLDGPGVVPVAFSIPAVSSDRSVVIEASCEGVQAAPSAGILRPALPDLGQDNTCPHPASSLPGKRARVEGPRDVPAAAPAARTPLQTLPFVLLQELVKYAGPDHFRYLNKDLNRVAQLATGTITIEGYPTDAELAILLRNHSRIHTIAFNCNGSLTPQGIIQALAHCPGLRRLNSTIALLTFTELKEIAEQHPHLVTLHTPDLAICDTELAALPPRITGLSFYSVNAGDSAIGRFRGLRTLGLDGSPRFTGEQLPSSLVELVAANCSGFTGRTLPASLVKLTVQDDDACAGPLELPNLESLTCLRCASFTSPTLLETIRTAPKLSTLVTDIVGPEVLLALPTGLNRLEIHTTRGLGETAWKRLHCLEHLSVTDVPDFTGGSLPRSLRSLSVQGCPDFRAAHVNALPLETLNVVQCAGYVNDSLPESLATLVVRDCPAADYGRLRTELPRLLNLKFLDYRCTGDGPDKGTDTPLFLAHPALEHVLYNLQSQYGLWIQYWGRSPEPEEEEKSHLVPDEADGPEAPATPPRTGS